MRKLKYVKLFENFRIESISTKPSPIECRFNNYESLVFKFDNLILVIIGDEGEIFINNDRLKTGCFLVENNTKEFEKLKNVKDGDNIDDDKIILTKLKALDFGGENSEWGYYEPDDLSLKLLNKYPEIKDSNKIIDEYHFSISMYDKCAFYFEGNIFINSFLFISDYENDNSLIINI